MCNTAKKTKAEPAGPYERKLVEISQQRLNEYKEMYKPMENEVLEEVRGRNSDTKKELFTNDAVAAAKLQAPQGSDALPEAGGKFVMAQGELSASMNTGMSGAAGNTLAEDHYAHGMMAMVGLGRGQAGDAGIQAGAASSRELATNIVKSNAKQNVRNAKMGMLGTVTGAGAGIGANKAGWFN